LYYEITNFEVYGLAKFFRTIPKIKVKFLTAVNLALTVLNLRNTFYIKYCKKTFLNPNFCNFRA